jgi:hypothetical protein
MESLTFQVNVCLTLVLFYCRGFCPATPSLTFSLSFFFLFFFIESEGKYLSLFFTLRNHPNFLINEAMHRVKGKTFGKMYCTQAAK